MMRKFAVISLASSLACSFRIDNIDWSTIDELDNNGSRKPIVLDFTVPMAHQQAAESRFKDIRVSPKLDQ